MRSVIRIELDDKEIRDALMNHARDLAKVQNPGSGSVRISGGSNSQRFEAIVEFQYQRAKQ